MLWIPHRCVPNRPLQRVDHIMESAREFSFRAPLALVLHVDQAAPGVQDDRIVCEAIRDYFTQLPRKPATACACTCAVGSSSLLIGLSVLALALIGSRMLGEGTIASTLRSMDIGGWVALWRPMGNVPLRLVAILGDRIFYWRLGRMPIQIRYAAA